MLVSIACSKEDSSQEIHETIYVRHQGADMPAFVHGNVMDKTFLVVLHGAGSYGLSFRNLAFTDNFEKNYVVVYFDQRGQSMSQGHYKKANDVIAQMASDVKALTLVLKHKYGDDIKLFLMGHSMGGLIGTKALLDKETRDMYNGWINLDGVMNIKKAGTYRAAHIYDIAEDQIAAGNSITEWEEVQQDLNSISDPDGDNYREMLSLTARGYSLLEKDEVVINEVTDELAYNTVFENNPISWFVSNLMNKPINNAKDLDLDYTPELGSLDIPCLFIYGFYDLSVPPQAGIDAIALWGNPDATYVEYEQSMHHPFYSEPDLFANDVSEFIDSH